MVENSISSDFYDKEINWNALQCRFPAIAFELSYGSYEKISCFYDEKRMVNAKGPRGLLYSANIEKEINQWKNALPLDRIDILYVYGTGLAHLYKELIPWLHAKKERKIVFFEEEISILEALFRQDIGFKLLEDRQVHFYYVPENKMWTSIIEDCVQQWLSDRIEWTTLRSYLVGREKKVRSLTLSLLRKSASVHAKVSESLHYSFLMQNIATNLLSIPQSFHVNQLKGKFKNIPAVICGAGYSLGEEVGLLKELEQKALVIAGGSAITALGHYGIRPHIAMAVDPNEEEYVRLKTSSCFETPFIYSSRLHKDVLPSTNMQMGYLCSNTGGIFEAWVHEKLGIHTRSFALDLEEEALSVTTLATAFAVELGCNPIIFCGVDLSYSNRQRYCEGVMNSSSVSLKELEKMTRSRDKVIRRKNVKGEFVYTLIKWVMEASALGIYAKKNQNTTFLNLSFKGLPILGVPEISREDLLKRYCLHDYDLRGMLRVESEAVKFPKEAKDSLLSAFEELIGSFEKSLPLLMQMIQEIQEKRKRVEDLSISLESGKMSVIEMDISEEPAYEVCFHPIFSIYLGILDWWTPSEASLDSAEERVRFLEKKEKIWTVGEEIGRECLAFLKNC